MAGTPADSRGWGCDNLSLLKRFFFKYFYIYEYLEKVYNTKIFINSDLSQIGHKIVTEL